MIVKDLSVTARSLSELECEAVMSTGSVDAEGDSIDPSGWQLDRFMKTPAVLWGHDAKSPPVAKVVKITPVKNGLAARIEFPPAGVSAKSDEIRGLVKAGILGAVSVGFRPIASTPNRARGIDYHEQELLELSFVSLPANSDALITAKGVGRVNECPRGSVCQYSVRDGRCQAPSDSCPLFSGVPSKALQDALADVRPELQREAQEQVRAALGAMRTPPLMSRGQNLFERVDLAASPQARAMRTLTEGTGLSEAEIAAALTEGLDDLKESGEMARIIKSEVRTALRNLSGRYA